MSGKSCGLPNEIPQRPMLGAAGLYRKNTNNTTQQIVSAVRQNRRSMLDLQKKTESLEQNILIERSIESNNNNVEFQKIEKQFSDKLDLVKGEFKEQMALLKNYIRVLETKLKNMENKIIKKTPIIPKKNNKKQKPKEEKPKEEKSKEEKPKEEKSKEEKPKEEKSKEEKPKEEKPKEEKPNGKNSEENNNVTLEIKEK